jgi:D-alanine-D-alanine ligase
MNKLNLGLLFGGRSGEHEVSLQSARSIASALDRDKFNLYLIALDKEGRWYLADESEYLENADDPSVISLKVTKDQQVAIIPGENGNVVFNLAQKKDIVSLDVAFPIIHGTFGEDGSLQGYMAMMNIPCVGADVLGSSVGMDKVLGKDLLIRAGVPVADYIVADESSDPEETRNEVEIKFTYPVFVKPSCSGSSVGVIKVEQGEQLMPAVKKALSYDSRVLIEEAIAGREIECAVLGNENLIASIPGEIIPTHSFYSYEAKYIDEKGARLELPANISEEIQQKVKELAKKTYKALSCSGMARVDMFLTTEGELILNEINTLPGFTMISMYPKLMELSGIPYTELLTRLVDLAIQRHKKKEDQLRNVLSAGSY